MNQNAYYEFLKNKRVLVIGPSKSTEGKNYRDFVNSFDVVVRLNRLIDCIDEMYDTFGDRIDVLYNGLNDVYANGIINIEKWMSTGLTWVCSPFAAESLNVQPKLIRNFMQKNKGRINFYVPSIAGYSEIFKGMDNTRPDTGCMAIIDLLRSELKELHTIGITFCLDGHSKIYSNMDDEAFVKRADNGCHRIRPKFLYMRNYILKDNPRFFPDPILKKLLEEAYS